jgi:hypothetical protein
LLACNIIRIHPHSNRERACSRGKIKHVWLDVNPNEHAAAVIAAAKS